MKKIKLPSKKVLKEAITNLEECDLSLKYMPGFAGVTITNIEIPEDWADEYDNINDVEISYSATIHSEGKSETYYDCFVTINDLQEWIKK